MENCFCSGWPEEEEAAVNKETSILIPWLPPNGSQYYDYPTTASTPPWLMPSEGIEEDRAESASKSHSQAEKRRRDRINTQLATLRKLIPKSDKMDKAALLENVVKHVKDLKRIALETSKLVTVPTDVDEVSIDFDSDQDSISGTGVKSKDNIFIRVTVCCDDRPELFTELNHALKGLKLKTVQADITSLGGRTKTNFVLSIKDSEEGVCRNTLKQSLKAVLSRIATSSSMASNHVIKSKRQRFFFPSYNSQSAC